MSDTLTIHSLVDRCRVLGPGTRAVVWVQGCPLRCRECTTPDALPFDGGEKFTITTLVERFDQLPDVSGLTFSGGEPMAQAEGLASLLDQLRERRPWTALAFTGYRLEHLVERGTPAQLELLHRLDALIDGPYMPEHHGSLRWRGSTNQRVHDLSGALELSGPDQSAGLELVVEDATVSIVGVPPVRGFVKSIEDVALRRGVELTTKER